MKYLIVVAHPDDELLGCGASIHKFVRQGNEVGCCILTGKSPTREAGLPDIAAKTHDFLGIKKSYIGDFGCMKMKDADHHSVVRFIESCIIDFEPDVLITHHPADLHNDHYITSICCQEASRLPQRMIGYKKTILSILFMEVKSSTDWALNSSQLKFFPNFYVGVSKEDVKNKIKSIKMYKDVIRKHPHCRSEKAIEALAIERGCESGNKYAEAFQFVFGVV